MAKKKKGSKNNQLFTLISSIILVVVVVLWFSVDVLVYKEGTILETSVSYLKATFGYKTPNLGLELFKFSILNLLPLIFIIISLLLLLGLSFTPKSLPKQTKLIVSALLLVSIVLLFLVKTLAVTELNLEDFKLTLLGIITPLLLIGSIGIIHLK